MIEIWPVDFSSASRVRKALSPPSPWKLVPPSASQTKTCLLCLQCPSMVRDDQNPNKIKSNQTQPTMSPILSKVILPRGGLYFLGENQIGHIGNYWEHPGKESFYSHTTRLPRCSNLGVVCLLLPPRGHVQHYHVTWIENRFSKISSIMVLNGFEIPLFFPPIVVN